MSDTILGLAFQADGVDAAAPFPVDFLGGERGEQVHRAEQYPPAESYRLPADGDLATVPGSGIVAPVNNHEARAVHTQEYLVA